TFPDYESFASADPSTYFEGLSSGDRDTLTAYTFHSIYLENLNNGDFKISNLPPPTQFAPIYGFASGDFDGDGHLDLIAGGNQSNARVSTGKFDANYGLMLFGDGTGQFDVGEAATTGIALKGDVRDFELVNTVDGPLLMVARSNDELLTYRQQTAYNP
ncbi:MAG: VCBS repeat-containing protein, partial [Bacteroidota bacterium]